MTIEVDNVTVVLSGRPVVRELSFQAMPGRLTAIIGPNGSGKTTTMKAISGERKFDGNIRFNGRDLRSLSAKQLALSRAVLAQTISLGFPFLVREVLEMGIVDPAKVTKSALQNAVSVASLLLTTDALIANKPEKKKKKGGPEGGAGDMDDMEGMDF